MCTASPASLLAVTAAAAMISAGCDEPSPPWAGEPDSRVIDESEPFLPRRPSVLRDAGAGGENGPGEEPLPEEEILARPAGRHGGLWLSCHDRFAPSGEPRRDITRLALSCGPPTGMRRASTMVSGRLDTDAAAGHRFTGEAGYCYRIFVAAGEGIGMMDVRVVDGHGRELARQQTTETWAVVEAERPFCVTEDGPLTLELDARGGAGAYAAELWSIPPRKRGP
ncbi:MAG TPA: hypothetical protein ENK57_26220 [Polyangiaceae bacterium]|nr:hypothetical protein [Polyangiaceae bacterium]